MLADQINDHVEDYELDEFEQSVERKLNHLRTTMLKENPTLIIGDHYENLYKLLNSPLYECFKVMPKPGVHHTHLTATADVHFLIYLTYNDAVYYSEKENLFHCTRNGCKKEGYM